MKFIQTAKGWCTPNIFCLFHSSIGSFQKTSIPPPRRKLEVNPPTPFGCPNTFTIIRNNFVSPPDGRNFLRGGSVDLFWNNPFFSQPKHHIYLQNYLSFRWNVGYHVTQHSNIQYLKCWKAKWRTWTRHWCKKGQEIPRVRFFCENITSRLFVKLN